MTDPSALDRLAQHFHTSPITVMLWICAITVVVIVAVFNIGIRWVKWTEDGDL